MWVNTSLFNLYFSWHLPYIVQYSNLPNYGEIEYVILQYVWDYESIQYTHYFFIIQRNVDIGFWYFVYSHHIRHTVLLLAVVVASNTFYIKIPYMKFCIIQIVACALIHNGTILYKQGLKSINPRPSIPVWIIQTNQDNPVF